MKTDATSGTDDHPWIRDIRENDRVSGCYLVREKKMGTTRRGDPFLTLVLSDRTGELAAKIWDDAERLSSLFSEGDVVAVEGIAGSYRGRIQVTVSRLKPVEGEADPGIFYETAPQDPSRMMASLKKILRGIENTHMRRLVDRFLADRSFISRFRRAPAAKNFHHGYVGGLLEHTLSVCRLADLMAGHYPALDRDLLVTGAFLHDIGKIRELRFDGPIDYTTEGRLVGHVALGAAMLDEKLSGLKDFPEDLAVRLRHLLLSHHGEYDFGSPKRPKFLEAFALHLIDDLDAKMNGLNRFMEKDRQEGAWTDFNRLFGRYFFKERMPGEPDPQEREPGDAAGRQGVLFRS